MTAPVTLADTFTAAVRDAFERRAVMEDPDEWVARATYDRYVKVLRDGMVITLNPRAVMASVPNTADGRTHRDVVGDILEEAALDFPELYELKIEQVSPVSYLASW